MSDYWEDLEIEAAHLRATLFDVTLERDTLKEQAEAVKKLLNYIHDKGLSMRAWRWHDLHDMRSVCLDAPAFLGEPERLCFIQGMAIEGDNYAALLDLADKIDTK